MASSYLPLFPDAFLASTWATDFQQFRGSKQEADLVRHLGEWATRKQQKETTAEGAFVNVFFKQTWGYRAAGEGPKGEGFTCVPQFPVVGAGQTGGTGVADLALGFFERSGCPEVPQVLCEFKDVRSGLDKPQKRKGNERSPVRQCADYLKEAANALYGDETIQPTWGIVSDMNEFRLYWRRRMPSQYQRFVLKPDSADNAVSLLGNDDAAAFQRFLFWRLFQQDTLLTTGGQSALERLLSKQWVQEKELEGDFYAEYQAYRKDVFNALVAANPAFKGTPGKLVRMTQRFLDRCIFILFCEDMGAALSFPQNILRDVLMGVSTDPDYDPEDDAAWSKVRKLFVSMRDGTPFRNHAINRFNGGLFASEPELESLHIPSRLFCVKGQGADRDSLQRHKRTLLFFSARYNFGVSGGTFERSIGLYTLGRIFEQSITELEFMEAKAEGRPSITELSKRKRDGVYYTPERVTSYIVEETVGALISEIRQRTNLDPLPVFDEEDLAHYRKARPASGKKDRRYNTEAVDAYVNSLDAFGHELDDIKVVDPACGSGAFLIQTLDRLLAERRWIASERERIFGTTTLFDTDAATKSILSKNIYGVDINEESIEITRLALWLRTALANRPLTSLDHNIRCGNSLIGPQFYAVHPPGAFSVVERERINAFDWHAAFPEVFSRPGKKAGFDCVVGNPPYVKLQHFKQVMPEVADFIINSKNTDGDPQYPSAQTQNYDMYLPFIDRGISLLNRDGRMGYIAPSVWLLNEHGEGLRQELKKTRRLERWVDFKDHKVFSEAMTYTALQFYRGHTNRSVAVAFAADGNLGAVDWTAPDATIEYEAVPNEDVWVFLPKREQALVTRLAETTKPLADPAWTSAIFQNIITSADHIYHLDRLGPGRYRSFPKKKPPVDVEIEDELMRPLVSGEAAKRYQVPSTSTCLLFPYQDSTAKPRIYSGKELEAEFPKAWRYLLGHEKELRARENNSFDDDQWFRFGRNQSIDKQRLPKLGVAQTVPEMRVFYDVEGAFCFNNVRVNGILTESPEVAFFLMGVLNSRVADFVFRRSAKPKEGRPSGAYFEANKQYIAPLPIPSADPAQQKVVGAFARELQSLHTKRRDTIASIDHRLASDQMTKAKRPPSWIWGDVDASHWQSQAPAGLKGRELKLWAKEESEKRLRLHYDWIDPLLVYGTTMGAVEGDGEITFFVADRPIGVSVYADAQEAPLILAQWKQAARDTFVSNETDAEAIIGWLLDLKSTKNAPLIAQIAHLNHALDDVELEIRGVERRLDDALYGLYGLSQSERAMVENETRARWEARMPMLSQ